MPASARKSLKARLVNPIVGAEYLQLLPGLALGVANEVLEVCEGVGLALKQVSHAGAAGVVDVKGHI